MSFVKKIIDGIKKVFSGSKYRVVLSIENKRIVLNTYKGTRKVPFTQLLNKHMELGKLSPCIKKEKERLVIPFENLEQVKTELSFINSVDQNNQLEVLIPEEIKTLKPINIPAKFEINYSWSDAEQVILQKMEGTYFGKGWFVSKNGYWNIPGLNENDELWLDKTKIQGKEILEFVSHVISEWEKRGLPVKCEISTGTEPAFIIRINEVGENSIGCEILWRVKAESISEIPSVEGYVISEHILCEGLNVAKLPVKLPLQSKSFSLLGDDIAVFQKHILPRIRKWTQGNVEELAKMHRILESAGELVLLVERKELNSVGTAEAVPLFVCEKERVKAEEISRKILPETKYIRLNTGWYPVEKLKQLGLGPMGRLMDGTSLSNYIKLTTTEILRRGSERFDGPWQRIEFPEIKLPADDTPYSIALKHLDFLEQWGIPGGFIGTFAEYQTTVLENLAKVLQKSPKVRILIVGKKVLFDGMSEKWKQILSGRYDGNKKDPELKANTAGVFAATPNALELYPGLSQAKWDILLIMEPDALVKSSTSRLFNNLVSCKARVVLGVFTGTEFYSHRQSFEALSTIFGIQDREIGWKYGLRNPNEKRVVLPPPYRLKYKPVNNKNLQGYPAELTVKSDFPDKTMPIPPRTEKRIQVSDKENSGIVISISIENSNRYYSGDSSFVEEAKKRVGYVEYSAKFIPFMSYWPTYNSMSREQQKWYFYWRGQVRKGIYHDTDLSYIFVHVYELINNVGVRDPMDGYWQLYNVWINYRECFPKLDHYLVDWITDYVALHKCNVDLLEIYKQLVNRNIYSFYPDILLASYSKLGLPQLPLALINQLTDYNVLRSKFYNEGCQALLEEYIPKTIEKVNAYLLQKHHLGILDFFKPSQTEKIQREPFRSAVYCHKSSREITIETVPFTKHKPLRDFLTSVVKHTENKLREIKGYTGRLRGYTIEPDIMKWIDDYLTSELKGPEITVKPSPKIEIDASKVAQLIKDSDKVRDMLIADEGVTEVPGKVQNVEPTIIAGRIERPPGTLDKLLTDLEPVHQMLRVLDRQQLHLLRVLAEHQWELGDKELNGLFPDMFIDPVVDSINEVSLKYVGDLLIAVERDKKVVADDFRDELEYLLPRLEEPTIQKAEDTYKALDLPEEWERFRANISAFQYKALLAIVKQEDLVSSINRIAEESFMMPEMLIDSINELALENIGDMIIEVESFPPVINEEYLEMVKKITA
ncbi:hypothetical protein BR63_03580 [Thermanaerosceptrum fracticalcis]|uniref:TerB N-terminal domain-containing protein n=1 Tax=Thermanaerosceptrum fracticalcis TaxID=1712410 RepID=A0A7G6E073_THEFR|nr:TerB N-terminal domain-containing protein [Thermanaerosceptrum fracticalcis]QNB45477.1 hypothetical protein BR63_03580 [Thermanaerosceptrum fracticalcis]